MANGQQNVSRLASVIAELRHRKVFRAAGVYVGGAWVVLKAADMLLPRFGFPNWSIDLVLWLMVLGFPLALAMSWMFDATIEGVKRTSALTPSETSALPHGRFLDFIIIAVLVGIVGYLYADRLALMDGSVVRQTSSEAMPSIAVLAFVNMSEDVANEYFSEGISEES